MIKIDTELSMGNNKITDVNNLIKLYNGVQVVKGIRFTKKFISVFVL